MMIHAEIAHEIDLAYPPRMADEIKNLVAKQAIETHLSQREACDCLRCVEMVSSVLDLERNIKNFHLDIEKLALRSRVPLETLL